MSLLPAESQARALLQRLARNWQRRARVKQAELDGETLFDASRDDFIPDLLPFRDHPAFLAAPDDVRTKILACGWLAYNEKTLDIESKIVAPACHHIMAGDVPGLQDGVSKQIAAQTLVDEAYHELLVLTACQLTRERRGLGAVVLPESQLIVKMRHARPGAALGGKGSSCSWRRPSSRKSSSVTTCTGCRRSRPSSRSIG